MNYQPANSLENLCLRTELSNAKSCYMKFPVVSLSDQSQIVDPQRSNVYLAYLHEICGFTRRAHPTRLRVPAERQPGLGEEPRPGLLSAHCRSTGGASLQLQGRSVRHQKDAPELHQGRHALVQQGPCQAEHEATVG